MAAPDNKRQKTGGFSVCFCRSMRIFVFGDALYLVSRARVWVEGTSEILLDHHFGDLDAGYLRTHRDDVGVIAELCALCLIDVVDIRGIDALGLIRGYHNSDTGASEQQTTLALAGRDRLVNCYRLIGVDRVVTAEINALMTEAFDILHYCQLHIGGGGITSEGQFQFVFLPFSIVF